MKIFSATQIKAWDAYTITHAPIASIDLMERAAQACTDWLLQQYKTEKHFQIFCGKGNNGGDGLAMARQLHQKGFETSIYILEFGKMGSPDFQQNLQSLHDLSLPITFIQSPEHFPQIKKGDVVIDALYGSGLNQPLQHLSALLVHHINNSGANILSIDIPSGMFMDASSVGNVMVKAAHTLTFERYKLALLMAENAPHFGEVHVLPIGLHPQFAEEEPTPYELLTLKGIVNIFKKRAPFAHKGTYGHALLMGGSWGKTGAVVLSAKAALRSGVGLLTTYIPKGSYDILQSSVPEAMALTDSHEKMLINPPEELEKYAAIGAGPGLGTATETQQAVISLIQTSKKPLVLDADALNIISLNKIVKKYIPHYSILTPHPKEAERLFGPSANDFERAQLMQQKATELQCIFILKGHHTLLAMPDGASYFNTTGNAGMAKGGSGDVLTGIITSFLAQGYTPAEAAMLGVYIHGMAGDLAAQFLSQEAMLPSDLIGFLSHAFKALNKSLA